jgi:hypothetical protein
MGIPVRRYYDGDKRMGGFAHEDSFKKIKDRTFAFTDGRLD